MEHTIKIERETLSDRSIAYNVRLGSCLFPACSKRDAYALAEVIADAINTHTVSGASVSYG
jgi:hypothetical protein